MTCFLLLQTPSQRSWTPYTIIIIIIIILQDYSPYPYIEILKEMH